MTLYICQHNGIKGILYPGVICPQGRGIGNLFHINIKDPATECKKCRDFTEITIKEKPKETIINKPMNQPLQAPHKPFNRFAEIDLIESNEGGVGNAKIQ